MTSFVNVKYSNQHPGVVRVESAIDAAKQLGHSFYGVRGVATLLLSAFAAAIMVVAYQVMDSVAEGHLLVIWIAMWGVAFAALALFASTARSLAQRLKSSLDAWSRSIAEARADQRLWAMARTDARVMADLQSAMTRADVVESPETASTSPAAAARTDGFPKAWRRGYYI